MGLFIGKKEMEEITQRQRAAAPTTAPPPKESRMDKLARRIGLLATFYTIVAVIGGFLASSNTPTVFIAAVCSIIPIWILYGFAWALADFQVSPKNV